MSSKKEDVKQDLHKTIHHKILHAKTRARITDKDVYRLSKEFFTELLDLDYEFSHEELIEELKKTYMEKKDLDHAIGFIKKMGKMEFTSNDFTHEELKSMLDELHEILDHLVHEEEHIGWFRRLKKRFGTKEAEKIIEEPTDKELIKELQSCLKNIKKETNEEQLRKYYEEAIRTYELLSEKAKIEYYNDLLNIYYALKDEKEETNTKEKQQEPTTNETTVTETEDVETTENAQEETEPNQEHEEPEENNIEINLADSEEISPENNEENLEKNNS